MITTVTAKYTQFVVYVTHTVNHTDGTPDTQINKVVCHPTLPIIVTAHEDKYIRFYDANTGKPACSVWAPYHSLLLMQGRSISIPINVHHSVSIPINAHHLVCIPTNAFTCT